MAESNLSRENIPRGHEGRARAGVAGTKGKKAAGAAYAATAVFEHRVKRDLRISLKPSRIGNSLYIMQV